MFSKITPEEAGISSKHVLKFIEKLEQRGLYSHGIILMRGDKRYPGEYKNHVN